jgi:colicin import membrane protein
MAPRLKVFVTRIGLDEVAVAVSSQKAALAAFGVRANLFGEGAATETNDPDLVKHALANPGELVRRRISLKGLDAPAPKRAAKHAPVRREPEKPRRDLAAERAAKAAVKAAEKALENFERDTKKELAGFDEERRDLDERETRFKNGVAARRKRLKDALAAAERDLP